MSLTYEQALTKYEGNEIMSLSSQPEGMRFLLLRSMSRSEHLQRLAADWSFSVEGIPSRQLLKAIFNSSITEEQIIRTIRSIYEQERNMRLASESELVSELYKVTAFDWGGLHQNSLEKTIVNNYVKKIRSFEILIEKIDNALFKSMRSYVLSSWYNHWTSIIIEDIFKDHPKVLPTVGLVKLIDFFVNRTPFDLKVTYLPEGYIKERREKYFRLRPELTEMKRLARRLTVHFERDLPPSQLIEDLWTKLNDHPSEEAQELITSLNNTRMRILDECINDPKNLIIWLYENQGERRFDAANRLFLVLVNTNNFFASWKLKRSRELLVEKIHQYLDKVDETPGMEISFSWKDRMYKSTSDMIIIAHSAQ